MGSKRSLVIGLLVVGLSFSFVGPCQSHPLDNWHLRYPSVGVYLLGGATFGNGLFVTVGGEGTILTSPTGVAWTKRNSGTTRGLARATFANGLFVVVGSSGTILTSPDGITWTQRTSPSTKGLSSVTYGNGIFVAVGGNWPTKTNVVLTSPDGVTWTERNTGTNTQLHGITFGHGMFVAVGGDASRENVILTSPDGLTWTKRTSPTTWSMSEVAYGNGIFVAVGLSDTILTSSDGATWTSRVAPGAYSENFLGVGFGNGTFVAVGLYDTILTSSNGINWTERKSASSHMIPGFSGVAFGNGTFVITGYGALINTSSDGGSTWVKRFPPEKSQRLHGVAYGNSVFVAAGDYALTSPNGVTWTESFKFRRSPNALTFGNGLFVGVGVDFSKSTVLIQTSPNGITWTERATSFAGHLQGLGYGNSTFVAAGNKGLILTSPDASFWTQRNSGTVEDLYGVGFGNGVFVVAGNKGTILTSPDGISWTKRDSGGSDFLTGVGYGNGTFVVTSTTSRYVCTSPDGVTWTKRSYPHSIGSLQSVAFGNGVFLAVGLEGAPMASSPDGVTWTQRRAGTYTGWFQGVAHGRDTFVAVGSYFYGPGIIYQSDPVRAAPHIVVNPASVDFGEINQGSSSDRQVTVGNTGDAALVVGAVSSPSPPFSKASDGCSGQSIPPGGTCAITYRFSPSSAGNFSGSSNIPSNDRQVAANLAGRGIAQPAETVSTPSAPAGPGSGKTGNSYSYSTGGSVSSYGHPVQYFFDWGNGANSGWLPAGTTSASNSWAAAGTFNVKVHARCADHPDVVSNWSAATPVTLTSFSYTVDTNPSGLEIVVDGAVYTAPQTFYWAPGSSHTLSVPSPQQLNAWIPEGYWTQYVFSFWSDGEAQSHSVSAPSSNHAYTATYTTQFGLVTAANLDGGGSVTPPGVAWYDNGETVLIRATPNSGYQFCQWSGSASGTSNPVSVKMDGPREVTANFIPTSPVNGWVGTCPEAVSSDWWFTGLHFLTADDGWAVGEDRSNGKGVLFRYLNDAWTEVSPPALNSEWGLNGVYFVSPSEGWAVGEDYGNETGVLLRYTNGRWADVYPPNLGPWWLLNGVHFTSSGSGWAAGDDYGNGEGILLRYSNGSWSNVALPDVSSWWWLKGVHFVSPNEGWAVGTDHENGKGVLLRYSDGSWSNVVPPQVSPEWWLNGVHFTSSNEGWAVGEDYENGSGVLLHYTNGAWSLVPPPSVSSGWVLNGVHFTASNEGWAVGEDYENGAGLLLQYSNGTWTRVVLANVSTDWRLASVHFVSPNEGWTVGGDYTGVGILIGYFKGSPVGKPNLTPYTPAGWSDKIVVSKTAGTNTDSSAITPADSLYVDWSVINNGQTAVSAPFKTRLYVDGGLKNEWTTNSLGVNQHFETFDFPIGTLGAGTHTVKIMTDATAVISENDEGDNVYEKTITVATTAPDGPDLTGGWMIAPAQTCKGTGARLKCKLAGSLNVRNAGNRDAPNSFVDFYLRRGAGEILMIRRSTKAIPANGSKALSFKYTLPTGENASGGRVEAVIDANQLINELDEDNNVIVGSIP